MTSHLNFMKLNEYLDGQLNKDELELVRAHLETCSECRSELVEITDFRKTLTNELGQMLEEMGTDTGWYERLVNRFRGGDPVKVRSRRAWVISPAYRPIIAFGTMAALLLLALYLPLEKRVPSQDQARTEEFQSPEKLPSPDKEMRLYGLDQRGGPEIGQTTPERVKVFTSDESEEVDRVFAALQEANLRPVRRGDEILVDRINQTEAERIISEISKN